MQDAAGRNARRSTPSRLMGKVFLGLLLFTSSAVLRAQEQFPGNQIALIELPDAPGEPAQSPTAAAPVRRGNSSISGAVLDTSGALVPNARVSLDGLSDKEERVTQSGAAGEFTFSDLPPGRFRLTVTSLGLGSFVSPEISLQPGQSRVVPEIVLPIAPTNVDVRVVVNDVELATEQVKLAEQQRVFGILPNFYSSYIWNAPPLTVRLKFDLAIHSAIDPVTFVASGFLAGAQQASNTFPGYGQGSAGYFRRFGAAYGDDVISRMIGSAILPSLLRQDPRYFYKGSGTTRQRIIYALAASVVCKGDDGHWQPNYSYVGGSFAAGAIANLYHPAGDRGTNLVVRNALIDTAGHAANNLLREFFMRRFTPKVPDYAQGQNQLPAAAPRPAIEPPVTNP